MSKDVVTIFKLADGRRKSDMSQVDFLVNSWTPNFSGQYFKFEKSYEKTI